MQIPRSSAAAEWIGQSTTVSPASTDALDSCLFRIARRTSATAGTGEHVASVHPIAPEGLQQIRQLRLTGSVWRRRPCRRLARSRRAAAGPPGWYWRNLGDGRFASHRHLHTWEPTIQWTHPAMRATRPSIQADRVRTEDPQLVVAFGLLFTAPSWLRETSFPRRRCATASAKLSATRRPRASMSRSVVCARRQLS